MNKNISSYLEGNNSYSLFYELSNGNILRVLADVPETQEEMNEMIKYDPEHAKEIEAGEKYWAVEYDKDDFISRYNDRRFHGDDEDMAMEYFEEDDVTEEYDYGTFYGSDARKNGLFDAIEARGLDITGRFTPYTTRLIDFIDPEAEFQKAYEERCTVKDMVFDEIGSKLTEATGKVTMEDGYTYDLIYDCDRKKLCYAGEWDEDWVTILNGDDIIGRDEIEYAIIKAFEEYDFCDHQIYPEYENPYLDLETQDGEEWVVGTLTIPNTSGVLQFYYDKDSESLDVERQAPLAPASVPEWLISSSWEEADNLVQDYLEKQRTQEKTKKKSRGI